MAEVKVAVVEGPETSMIVEVVSAFEEILACFVYPVDDGDDDGDDEEAYGSVKLLA